MAASLSFMDEAFPLDPLPAGWVGGPARDKPC